MEATTTKLGRDHTTLSIWRSAKTTEKGYTFIEISLKDTLVIDSAVCYMKTKSPKASTLTNSHVKNICRTLCRPCTLGFNMLTDACRV